MSRSETQKLQLTVCNEGKGFRKFRGLGVQWDPHGVHPVTEEEWNAITDHVDAMAPAFVRLMIYAPTYCAGIGEDGEPIYRFDSPGVQALLRELDWLEEHHVETVLGEWEAPGRFGGPFEGIGTGDERWTRIIGGFLDYLLNEKKYTCIHYFNYINEANSEWSWCADWTKWRKGILSLHDELIKRGLDGKIGITGPDSVWDDEDIWIRNTVGDREIHDRVALYDIHMYPTIEEIRSGWVEEKLRTNHQIAPDKDFYMTEVGMLTGKTMGDSQPNVKKYEYGVIMADVAAQVIAGGLNGLSIWDLDDAMHDQGNGYPKTDIRSLKQWGFFNSVAGRVFGIPEEEKLRPHFFTWSLMCRLFRPGSEVLKTLGNTGIPRLTAMSSPQGKLNLMVVNHAENGIDVELLLPVAEGTRFNCYVYRENGYRTDEKGYPLAEEIRMTQNGGLEVSLMPMEVLFLAEM